MKLLRILLEIIGWLQIVIATTIGAALIALPVYIYGSNIHGKTIACIIAAIGFIAGVIWATRIWKKYGTIEWLSRIRRIS